MENDQASGSYLVIGGREKREVWRKSPPEGYLPGNGN